METNNVTALSMRLPVELLLQLPADKNSVISPFGIRAALGLAANGASGKCLEELLALLEASDVDAVNSKMREVGGEKEGSFCSACTLTAGPSFVWNEEFLKVAKDIYRTSVEQAESGPAAVLQNKVDFRGNWLLKLDEKQPGMYQFQNADGTVAEPAFLALESELRYYEDDSGIQAVSLLYSGGRIDEMYEMTFVLSDKAPGREEVERIFQQGADERVSVLIPTFRVESKWENLKGVLRTLGIQDLFDPHTTGFCGCGAEALYAEEVKQEAEICVNKTGTEAFARTTIGVSYVGMSIEKSPKRFLADRPFYYFLYGFKEREILFEGKICQL